MTAPKKIGGLTFAFGAKYQKMAALQAHTFDYHDLPLSVIVYDTDTIQPELLMSPADIIKISRKTHKAYLPFEYEKWAYELSPYDLTIKTDADLLLPRGWLGLPPWTYVLPVVSGQPVTIQGATIKSSPYRRKWSMLGLPEAHSAFFAFNRSVHAKKFFDLINDWYINYHQRSISQIEEQPSTDLVYSLAWNQLFGTDLGPTLPFYHMKYGTSGFNTWHNNWLANLTYLNDEAGSYVNGIQLLYPFHYFDKSFIEGQHVYLD